MGINAYVLRREYRDSLALMALSAEISSWPGVVRAIVVVGTPSNRQILEQLGLLVGEARHAGADDMIVAFEAESQLPEAEVWRRVRHALRERQPVAQHIAYPSLQGAVQANPSANVVNLSVPGEHAAALARQALTLGLHVFCFSDHVSLKDEIALKQLALDKGLLMMGPDCGTSYIDGYGLGFANVVRRGPIGVVSASGSGLQEFSVLVDAAGSGLSQGIGVGGRDLGADVGGMMTLSALSLLAREGRSQVLVVLAKKGDEAVMRRIAELAQSLSLPTVLYQADRLARLEPSSCNRLFHAGSLQEAANLALSMSGATLPRRSGSDAQAEDTWIQEAIGRLGAEQRHIRGFFAGGSLCQEAQSILSETLGELRTNLSAPLAADTRCGHVLLDVGAEEYTHGRAHPFIDTRWREMEIVNAARDPSVGVILVDVVLGWGCHPNPAGAIAGAIRAGRELASQEGRGLAVVAILCGTERDSQGLAKQRALLAAEGVCVCRSTEQAAQVAARLASRV